jgi:hypothetical protein
MLEVPFLARDREPNRELGDDRNRDERAASATAL